MLNTIYILGIVLLTSSTSTATPPIGSLGSLLVEDAASSLLFSTADPRSVIEHPAGLNGEPTVGAEAEVWTENKYSGDSKVDRFSLVSVKNVNKRDKEIIIEDLPVAMAQSQGNNARREDDGTYTLEDNDEVPCILAYFKLKITVYYPTTEKGDEKYQPAYLSPPDDAKVSGLCDRKAQTAVLDLTWETGSLQLRFRYDEPTDSFYVEEFNLRVDTSNEIFEKPEKEEMVVVRSPSSRRFWQTNFARSFRCHLLHDVQLVDESQRYEATLHFEEARVQALTETYRFKPPKHCIHRSHRDPNVPWAVAGVLIFSTVLTVAGYAVFRYLKVKKFQYEQYAG